MAAIHTINAFKTRFHRENNREPTANEVAAALRLDIARPETIRKAQRAAMKFNERGIRNKNYDTMSGMNQDNARCIKSLSQLMS